MGVRLKHLGRGRALPPFSQRGLYDFLKRLAARSAALHGRLRAEGLEAGHMAVFAHTTPIMAPWYSAQRAAVIEPTADTPALIGEAVRLLKAGWRPGYRYFKAGVMLTALAPAARQASLFAIRDPVRLARAMAALDAVNARFGRGTLRPAST